MRAAINMDKMEVTHVHRVQDILHGLVSLECRNIRNMRFEDTESPYFLATLSNLQMQILHVNVTGDKAVRPFDHMRAAIAVALDRMKPMLVDDQELERQLLAVKQQLEGGIGAVPNFKYKLGGRSPITGDYPAAKTLALDANGAAAAQLAIQRMKPLPPATIPATLSPRALREKTGGSAAPRGPVAAPTGGTGGIIWQVADKMWADAGSPRDVSTVLKLRVKMMEILEKEHEVKRTTSSNTLGQWMKNRLSEK